MSGNDLWPLDSAPPYGRDDTDADDRDNLASLAGRDRPFMTGRLQLESLVEPERDERPARHPGWDNTQLHFLTEVGKLSADSKIKGTMAMIRELKKHPQLLAMLLDEVGDLRGVWHDEVAAGSGPERRQERDASRDLPERLVRANARRARRRARSTRRRGRPRLAGHYCLAYLTMVMMRITEVSTFVEVTDFEEIWTESGFEQAPDYSTVWFYFKHLEQKKEAFQHVAEWLIRHASTQDPRIGQFVWVDATKWQTNARLEHCCPDHDACKALSEENKKRGIRPPARKPKRVPEDVLQKAHEIESQREEAEDDLIPEELRLEQFDFDPEADFGRDEEVAMEPIPSLAFDNDYQYFEIHGHLYRTCDKSAGMRRLTRKSGRIEYWLGGYALSAVDMYTKTILAIICFPANDQEYDHYPELMRRVRRGLGRYPLAVSVDAFSSIASFYRWNTMRAIATIAPYKYARRTDNREDLRTDLYDEHGIPRCQHCGGEGDQDSPGYGLYFDSHKHARIRFRCKMPQPGEAGCLKKQSILCSENWRLLIPLSRKTELYYALRKRHLFFEGTLRHWRQLYGGLGKETMSRLARRGVDAQELRAQGALMMQWFRISLRNGWLARPDGTLWSTINEQRPVQLSGERQLSNGTTRRGIGQSALNRVLGARRRRRLDLPYGAVARRKGYLPPEPEPPPPDSDGRPPPELVPA